MMFAGAPSSQYSESSTRGTPLVTPRIQPRGTQQRVPQSQTELTSMNNGHLGASVLPENHAGSSGSTGSGRLMEVSQQQMQQQIQQQIQRQQQQPIQHQQPIQQHVLIEKERSWKGVGTQMMFNQ